MIPRSLQAIRTLEIDLVQSTTQRECGGFWPVEKYENWGYDLRNGAFRMIFMMSEASRIGIRPDLKIKHAIFGRVSHAGYLICLFLDVVMAQDVPSSFIGFEKWMYSNYVGFERYPIR